MITEYIAEFDELLVDGVFGISLVENPATQQYFLKMSEQKKAEIIDRACNIQFKTINKEKRIITGLVLEPNVPVYRAEKMDDGSVHEFNVTFEAHTIENLAFNFYKQDFHKNSTIEHDLSNKIKGVTFVESWIITDSKNDKSNALGLEHPEGSWMITMKVDDIELWNDYIKTGRVKGFSVDGMVQLKKVKPKTDIKMSTITDALKGWTEKMVAFAAPKKVEEIEVEAVEIKFGEIKMEGGEVIFEYEGEVLEAGQNIFAIDPQDASNRIPVPVGQYPLEDGSVLIVTEEGIAGEVQKAGEPEPKEEPKKEEAVDMATEAATEATQSEKDIKSILIKYEDVDIRMKNIEDSLEGFKQMNDTLLEMKKEMLAFSEAPSAQPKKRASIKVPTNAKERIAQAIESAEQ